MSIQTVVEGQITSANEWATASRETADAAIAALAEIDIPYLLVGPVPFTPLVTAAADIAPQPGPISVGPAPPITAISDVTKPVEPAITEAELGALLAIVLPDVPIIEFPSANIEPPAFAVSAPQNWSFCVSNIPIVDDPMVQAVSARLTRNILYGGTGLSADVEDAIWNRDLERNEQALRDATDKVTSMWASKNFSLPDGFLAHSLSEIQKEYMNKLLDRSREIAIKQADLEQSNLFKSMELSINLAAKLIELFIQYESLVLRSQEDTAKFANEYIDLQIKTYMSKVEAYKATAMVYETLVRANLAKVEVYKTQLEAQRLILSINEQTVRIYIEEIRAATMLIEQYKIRVDAMVAELSADRMKIDINKLQMDAWAKEADVKIAQFNGSVDLYRAVAQQNISLAELQTRQAEATLRANISATELSLKAADINARSLQVHAQLKVEAQKAVAASSATLAAGAMAGVSASAGMSYGESRPLVEGA